MHTYTHTCTQKIARTEANMMPLTGPDAGTVTLKGPYGCRPCCIALDDMLGLPVVSEQSVVLVYPHPFGKAIFKFITGYLITAHISWAFLSFRRADGVAVHIL